MIMLTSIHVARSYQMALNMSKSLQLSRLQVLVIDDDDHIRMLLELVLQAKYEVVAKEDAMSGMVWLSEGNIPNVIIVDLEMPHFDGKEFLNAIKVSGFFRNIPVIVLASNPSAQLKKECMALGACNILSKPFKPEETFDIISQAIQNCPSDEDDN